MTASLLTSSISPLTVPSNDEEFWKRFGALRERRRIRGTFTSIAQAKRELFFFCREPLRRELSFVRKSSALDTRIYAEDEYLAVMANFNEAISMQVYGESILAVHLQTPMQDMVRHVVEYQDQRTVVSLDEAAHAYTVVA